MKIEDEGGERKVLLRAFCVAYNERKLCSTDLMISVKECIGRQLVAVLGRGGGGIELFVERVVGLIYSYVYAFPAVRPMGHARSNLDIVISGICMLSRY